jgi:hypothetical protein
MNVVKKIDGAYGKRRKEEEGEEKKARVRKWKWNGILFYRDVPAPFLLSSP